MKTITFDQIRERVARHTADEAAQNAPAAVACRAIGTLCAALEELDGRERADVLALLAEEIRPIVAELAIAV